MPKPKSAKLLCTPNVFERCFINQGHLAQVPVRLYIRMVDGQGGGEVSATISNPAYDPNAEIPQSGSGRRTTSKKIRGALKKVAKAGKIASLATLAAGQPEIAAPLGAVSEAIDQIGSGDFNADMIAAIPKKKKKKVPRYTLAAAKKNFDD